MNYLTLLDYHHLDNSFFMQSFAEAMARQNDCSGIILHGDSLYTERLIQTGLMRKDAVIRSTKELNHRIVALLADKGVAGIGIHGFQKMIIRKSGDDLFVQARWIEDRPAGTHLIVSNLIWNSDNQAIASVPLNILAEVLCNTLNRRYLIVFPKNDGSVHAVQRPNDVEETGGKDKMYTADDVPDDLNPLPAACYISTPDAFGKLPDTSFLQKISG